MSRGNNQIFLSFLGTLRDKYLKRKRECTFESVILAGVHDVKSLKLKIRDGSEAGQNPGFNPKHWSLDDIDWSFRWLTRAYSKRSN